MQTLPPRAAAGGALTPTHLLPAVTSLIRNRHRPLPGRFPSFAEPPGWFEELMGACYPVFPALRPGLLFRKLGSCLVIDDPVTGDTHKLNRPAAFIAARADGSRSLQEVCDKYAARFHLDEKSSAFDVRRTAADLFNKKVLVVRYQRT